MRSFATRNDGYLRRKKIKYWLFSGLVAEFYEYFFV
ncbi:hypothetical protein VAA_01289 [Vibrio anguillarum 775]|nr:hypothetical protein VAA_01289 [Vibrio anguillarum 775]